MNISSIFDDLTSFVTSSSQNCDFLNEQQRKILAISFGALTSLSMCFLTIRYFQNSRINQIIIAPLGAGDVRARRFPPIDVEREEVIHLNREVNQVLRAEVDAEFVIAPVRENFAQAARKREGIEFFREFILNPGQIDEETRTQVLEREPDVYTFVLARSLYIYIFGLKREEEVPLFFKAETRDFINKVREEFKENREQTAHLLEPLMHSFSSFEKPSDENKAILNRLKEGTYEELRNSLFITECWAEACNQFEN